MPVFWHHETAKAFDVVLTGDHVAFSVMNIGDDDKIEEQDFQSVHEEMVQVWGESPVLFKLRWHW